MTTWTFTRDPLQDTFRLMAGDRIIGMVATEADAKLICEAVNSHVVPTLQSPSVQPNKP